MPDSRCWRGSAAGHRDLSTTCSSTPPSQPAKEGKPYAALTFQTVDLAVARSLASSTRTVEALVWRSKAWTAVPSDRVPWPTSTKA